MKPAFMKKAGRETQVAAAQAFVRGMERLPPYVIVNTINTLIGVLRKRGVTITDWDDRTKDVHGMKYLGNTAFILAPQTRAVGDKASRKTPEGREE